jgi:hypothetical protein
VRKIIKEEKTEIRYIDEDYKWQEPFEQTSVSDINEFKNLQKEQNFEVN